MKTRIYIVQPTAAGIELELPVLVDASSAAMATNYIADTLFTVRIATGHEIAYMMGVGQNVLKAVKAARSPTAPGAWLPVSKAGEE